MRAQALAGDPQRTTLTIPPDVALVRLARLVATGIGSGLGMGVDEVEDLRIAADEACCLLLERHPPDEVRMMFTAHDGRVDVEVSCPLPADRTRPAGFGADVLTAVTHTWDWVDDDIRLTVRFTLAVSAPPSV